MENSLKKPLIPERVLMVGEGKIPGDVLEKVKDEHLKIFLQEEDPELWPLEIRHLARYLPEEEQLRWKIFRALSRHRKIIDGALKKWLSAVEKEISDACSGTGASPSDVRELVADYLKELVSEVDFLSGED